MKLAGSLLSKVFLEGVDYHRLMRQEPVVEAILCRRVERGNVVSVPQITMQVSEVIQ